MIATPIDRSNPDAVAFDRLLPWLAIAKGRRGAEHVALSDGLHRIRLDVAAGSVAGAEPVLLHYRLKGIASADPQILPLRRFLDLCRHGRFARSLFPSDRRVDRWLTVLRVHDALDAGASQREIAEVLFGENRVLLDWRGASDSLRSRIRRLTRDARTMARGGWRSLMGGQER